jgi:hypothetical protein
MPKNTDKPGISQETLSKKANFVFNTIAKIKARVALNSTIRKDKK